MNRPIHFEIQASDPERLIDFYSTVFGWVFSRWGDVDYWVIATGDGNPMTGVPDSEPGINGGLMPRPGPPPAPDQPLNAFPLTVGVPDCQEYLDRALACGASLAIPRRPIPGVGWLANVTDPDGNLLGLMEADPDAPMPEA